MLTIRREQLGVFQQSKDAELVQAIAEQLGRDDPTRLDGLTERTVQQRITMGLKRARGYGLSDPRDAAQFVMLMFAVAPNFDEQPFIAACLTDEELAGLNRMNVLLTMASADDWDEARRAYDAGAWEETYERKAMPAP
jgi:hypothetical protein